MSLLKVNGKKLSVTPGKTLLQTLLDQKVLINHSCGGMGSCGTCRVQIEKGLEHLPPRSELEQDIAEMYGYEESERLACQLIDWDSQIPLEVLVPEVGDVS